MKTTAKAKGFIDMPLVVVTHPIALNDDAAIRRKAEGAIEDVVLTLVTEDEKTAAKGGC